MIVPSIDQWYLENLVCPVDKSRLQLSAEYLVSAAGRRYPVVEGIPVMLVDGRPTMDLAKASLERANGNAEVIDQRAPHLFLETLGISEREKETLIRRAAQSDPVVDPVVSVIVGATSGYAYVHLTGQESWPGYPVPEIALPVSEGARLLDVGCNWGRWSIAAARKGYAVAGIDPSLGAVLTARKVATSLGLDIKYVVGDARYLPFPAQSFDVCYSYSVLQHFSEPDLMTSLAAIQQILKEQGVVKIQLANAFGIRSLQHQFRRRFRKTEGFQVRYYSVSNLRRKFISIFGAVRISSDCYFGLGWQFSDRIFVRSSHKPILYASEFMRRLSHLVPPLVQVSDSVFCTATVA